MCGRVSVGTAFETGKNLNMMIGGKISLNVSQSQRIVLSFIPKNIAIPPYPKLPYTFSYLI
jgi:hypothetical protein